MLRKIIPLLLLVVIFSAPLHAEDSVFVRFGFFPESEPRDASYLMQIAGYTDLWRFALGIRSYGIYEKGWEYRNYADSAFDYSCPHLDFELYQVSWDSTLALDIGIGRRLTSWLAVSLFLSPGLNTGTYQRLEKSNTTGLWYAPAPAWSLNPTIDAGGSFAIRIYSFDLELAYFYAGRFIMSAGYKL